MNRVFRAEQGGLVADGTRVFPFLNPADGGSGLPVGLIDGVSLATGELAGQQRSRIHRHPLLTQTVWVIEGRLQIRMKDADAPSPYLLSLNGEDAAVARPGTFIQLINAGDGPCRVLYVCSPAYVSLRAADGSIVYDDAEVFDDDWGTLAAQGFKPLSAVELDALEAARRNAIAWLARQKRDAEQ